MMTKQDELNTGVRIAREQATKEIMQRTYEHGESQASRYLEEARHHVRNAKLAMLGVYSNAVRGIELAVVYRTAAVDALKDAERMQRAA